jgi:D-alanyl-D-alanine carboxypeptidase/D-alanyl-D-alanine-endopeptidase (penicillin-binding protein 4)
MRPAARLLAAVSIAALLQQSVLDSRLSLSAFQSQPAGSRSAATEPPAGAAPLVRDLDALLAAPTLDRGTWGVVVRALTGNETLFAKNGGKLLLPASNMKVVTLAAAADLLGWNYTFETRLVAAGAVEAGVLRGDLVVVGSGDPSIDDWDGAATVLFKDWAETLKAGGIRTITGRIVGDDDSFDDEMLGSGWAWDDLDRSFATGIGALQFNQNTAQITIVPGARSGAPATATVGPAGSGLTLRNLMTTGGPQSIASLAARRRVDSPTIELRGSLPAGSAPLIRNVAVVNPTTYFVSELRDGLIKSGVDVLGQAVDIDDITDPPSRARGSVLVMHRSAPLSALAVTMMRLSQNLYAETLLKTIGARNTIGSVESGRRAVTEKLQEWGIAVSDFRIADGSGLSPYDAITPDALATILAHVANDARLRDPYQATLPIAGQVGTLSSRMKGTPAEGNAKAKTGTMSNVHAVSGYVRSAEGEPLVFSILANNFGGASDAVQQTIDAIIVRLAQFRRRQP